MHRLCGIPFSIEMLPDSMMILAALAEIQDWAQALAALHQLLLLSCQHAAELLVLQTCAVGNFINAPVSSCLFLIAHLHILCKGAVETWWLPSWAAATAVEQSLGLVL